MGVLILVGLGVLVIVLSTREEKHSSQSNSKGKVSAIIQFIIFGIATLVLSIFSIIQDSTTGIIFGIIGIIISIFLLYMAYFTFKEK